MRSSGNPRTALDISVGSSRLGNKIIEIHNISKSFENKKIIDKLEYTLARHDRIGIIGKNGLGKSTLINILNGKIKPDSGSIEIGETVKIGCFSQDDSHMHPDMRAIDYVKEESDYITTADGTKITASQMCEKFLFDGTMQYTYIRKLSGGERRRLHLLRVLMSAPNVLLLDEPTNDLDIETLNRLEDYLDEFNGVLTPIIPIRPLTAESVKGKKRDEIRHELKEEAVKLYEEKEAEFPEPEQLRELERVVLLKCIDSKWMDHIDDMEILRQGIGLAAYGQRDPVVEYKMSAFDMFNEMITSIQEDTLRMLYHVHVEQKIERDLIFRADKSGSKFTNARFA